MIRKMNRHRIFLLLVCCILITVLVLPYPVTAEASSVPAQAVEIPAKPVNNQTVDIASVEDFVKFSENCISESYSTGRNFILHQDMDLAGIVVRPAAIFAGTFEGNGYTIQNFSFSEKGSDIGLFRYVAAGAVVQNLNVEGTLTPRGIRRNIGGIAGVNEGMLKNCSFDGYIMAEEAVGGIAGFNKGTGMVTDCTNQAELIGNLMVGGIAGKNEGTVTGSTNYGLINTSKEGVIEEEQEEYKINEDRIISGLKIEKVNDIGGIAGYSKGTVKESRNYGGIGYAHTGYNIGGITGRQNGLVYRCANYGAITGRKDAGGITGQFEPYLTVFYKKDTFDRLDEEWDVLADISDSITAEVRSTSDSVSENLDEAKAIMEEMKNYTRERKDNQKMQRDQFSEVAGRQFDILEEAIDDIDMDFSSKTAEKAGRRIRTNLKKTRELLNQLKSGSGGLEIPSEDEEELTLSLGEDLENMFLVLTEFAVCMEEIISDTEILLTDGFEGIQDGIFDLKDDLETVRMETRILIDLIRERKHELTGSLDTFDEEITQKLDRFYDEMDGIYDQLKSGKNRLRDENDRLNEELEEIHRVIKEGKERVSDNMEGLGKEDETLFDDISNDDSGVLEAGKIMECTNAGTVVSDYQAGGIAGMIGVELRLDPEYDIDVSGNRTLNSARLAKAVVWNCRNEGAIMVNNDYAGGIVGKGMIGALISNQNYADITATDGKYAGGIVGSISSLCRDNSSLSRVKGDSYLGGIAGWGKDLFDNKAIVTIISDSGEYHGSIAGGVKENGGIRGNYYVNDGVGAVDGVTRMNEANGLSYEQFVQLEQVPDEFTRLQVTFMAEGEVIQSIPCVYGKPLPENTIPQAPQKDGHYYVWETADLSEVKGNLTIHAVYRPWTTTIAVSDEPLPLLLAESDFHPEARLTVSETAYSSWKVSGNYRIRQGYTSVIEAQGQEFWTAPIVFRVLVRDFPHASMVGVVVGNEIRQVETKRDGSYLVFQMDQPGSFGILERDNRRIIWLSGVLLAGILVAAIVLVKGRRKK